MPPNKACSRLLNRGHFTRWYRLGAFPFIKAFPTAAADASRWGAFLSGSRTSSYNTFTPGLKRPRGLAHLELTMQLDVTKLMYATFQRCRHALPDTLQWLASLAIVLPLAEQQASMLVTVPSLMYEQIPSDVVDEVLSPWAPPFEQGTALPPASKPYLELIVAATKELQRLWNEQDVDTLRGLGYAVHNLPAFVVQPMDFDQQSYEGSLRHLGAGWTHLSPNVRQHFCTIMQYTEADIVRVIAECEA